MSSSISRRNCDKSESKNYDGPILSFKTSKPNESKITSMFKDEDDKEVKGCLNVYQNGDAKDVWLSFTSKSSTSERRCLGLPYRPGFKNHQGLRTRH
jgi:hypothetical protein